MGFVLVSLVVLVRGRLLDADLYLSALVRTDAYERVYTEVLADPAFAELQEELLGGLGIDESAATQVRTVATSSLRLGVPPSSTLRRGTETFIDAVLGYLRGDTARLDGDVDVTEVLGRVRDSGVAWVHSRLATARALIVPTVVAYRDAVDSFADRLVAGTVPKISRCSAALRSTRHRCSTSSSTGSARTWTRGGASRSGRTCSRVTSATP